MSPSLSTSLCSTCLRRSVARTSPASSSSTIYTSRAYIRPARATAVTARVPHSPSRSFHSAMPVATNMTDVEAQRLKDLQTLLSRFRDPSSPYFIPPGARGPEHENDHSVARAPPAKERFVEKFGDSEAYERARIGADQTFASGGYDTRGRLEWPVAWGDCDMFQHANNVQFVKWFESARIRYTETLDLPPQDIKNVLTGKGTGVILKDVSVKYKAPVNYPDTLIIASRPHSVDQERASFGITSMFFSLAQHKVVATADSTMVMYDYDRLEKGAMNDTFRDALLRRIK